MLWHHLPDWSLPLFPALHLPLPRYSGLFLLSFMYLSTATHIHLVFNTARNLTKLLNNLYNSGGFEKPENQTSCSHVTYVFQDTWSIKSKHQLCKTSMQFPYSPEGLKSVWSQHSYLLSPHLHTNMAISVFLSEFFPFFFLFILRTLFPDPVELRHVRDSFEPWCTSCCHQPPHPLQHLDSCSLNPQATPWHQGVSCKTVFKHSASSSTCW